VFPANMGSTNLGVLFLLCPFVRIDIKKKIASVLERTSDLNFAFSFDFFAKFYSVHTYTLRN